MKFISCLLIGLFLSCGASIAGDKNEKKQIRDTVNDFMISINNQNVEKATNTLLKEFRAYIISPKGMMVMTFEDITAALTAKKIGGENRKIKIRSVDIRSNMATVKVEATNQKGSFVWFLSLLTTEDGWKIANTLATFEPAAS